MRSAEEIMDDLGIFLQNDSDENSVKEAINEARKEAIIECAEKAKCEAGYLEKSEVYVCLHRVDKSSILSLLNELT